MSWRRAESPNFDVNGTIHGHASRALIGLDFMPPSFRFQCVTFNEVSRRHVCPADGKTLVQLKLN